MEKYAILFSSRTGNTRILADAIRAALPEEAVLAPALDALARENEVPAAAAQHWTNRAGSMSPVRWQAGEANLTPLPCGVAAAGAAAAGAAGTAAMAALAASEWAATFFSLAMKILPMKMTTHICRTRPKNSTA